MDVGSNIRELRRAHSLTQEQLAATLYVSRQTISHWESGRTMPDAQSLVLMSALFGVTVDELVREGVSAMADVSAQQRRRTATSYVTGAAIGLLGCAAVAPALVPAAGPLVGGALSLAPLATALAVTATARARSHEGAALDVLRSSLKSNVTLRLRTAGGTRDLAVTILDAKNEQPYLVRHTACVPRGERWEIEDASGGGSPGWHIASS